MIINLYNNLEEEIKFDYEGIINTFEKGLEEEKAQFLMLHPPYADIIKYSEDISEDMSLLKVKDFLEEMKKVAAESYRVLKKDKFCAVLMGDTRQKGHMIPMSSFRIL